MSTSSRDVAARPRRRFMAMAAVSALAGSLAAAGIASAATPSSDQVQATVNKAFAAPVAQGSLTPIIRNALARATVPLSSSQLNKALECWKATTCTIGNGEVTLGIADGFGENTWRKFTKMEIILQALAHPEVGKIVYTDAKGQLAAFQANIRSLSAQGAKAIVTYDDFGPAAAPAYTAAQRAGAFVSSYVSPLRPVPGIPTSAVAVTVGPDICKAGIAMADATAKAVGKTGGVALFAGVPGNPQDVGWQKCATARFASKYPGLKVTYKADTNWTPAGVFQASSGLISSGKEAKAVLYSYSNPMPQLVKAFNQAGKPVPALITWTQDNGLSCTWKKAKDSGKSFALYQTNALNWVSRVSTEAVLARLAGQSVPATVVYPQPYVTAKASDCVPSKPADFPGNSSLIPTSLINKMLT
jgi:ABC-type sugar transport system substrate-binding protein